MQEIWFECAVGTDYVVSNCGRVAILKPDRSIHVVANEEEAIQERERIRLEREDTC